MRSEVEPGHQRVFVRPIELIVNTTDRLERQLDRADRF
jgi:hypothetical protein